MRLFGWKSLLQLPVVSIRSYGIEADITYFKSTTSVANSRSFGVKAVGVEKENYSVHKIKRKFSMVFKNYLPYRAAGEVVSGFGRGSKSLGCPTANFSEKVVETLPGEFETGVYYGWASLEKQIYKMVMSIGWNPFYKNDKKSMEIHLIHKFDNDFYGKELKVVILGYIRPEMDFSSIDELIKKIQNDIEFAENSLNDLSMVKHKEDPFLTS